MPFIAANSEGPVHVEEMLTREHFETLCRPLIERLARPVQEALKELYIALLRLNRRLWRLRMPW